ncbi:MAG TPA: protein kinase [Pyrinomonadaceae bacterium]
MTPERWQQIDQLFHSALERTPCERAAFLAQACKGDESLRQEVESLIGSHERSESFIETPAGDIAAELLSGRAAQLIAGQYVGHYVIVSLLGEGGMGEVYLVQDSRLGRQVALKRLPAQFTLDADRVHRFEQEARTVSALNHPNIVTIHEIGRSNSSHFITTEFIEGHTLRQHLANGPLKLDEALDVAVQIGSALMAAHAAGIVHRDIKPENIMIRPDGYVKVLDFGLAKLVDQKNESVLVFEESTGSENQTGKGLILGTVNYMSPEQAKGELIDERTDIFSFGATIYEMVSGRTPFTGASTMETLASLINAEPPPLPGIVSNVPDDLQRIVSKTLCKDREKRYQTVKDLLADLKNLRQSSAFLKQWETSQSGDNDAVSGRPATTGQTRKQTAETQHSFAPQINRRKLVAFALTALISSVGLAYYFLNRTRTPLVFQVGQVTRLTSTGRVKSSVVSPDGNFIVYAEENAGQQSLWRRDIVSESNVQIAPSANIDYRVLNITPDGNSIYFVDAKQSLYQIPVLGGPLRKIAEGLLSDSRIGFSPGGKQFTFVRRLEKDASGLFIIDANGTNERMLKFVEQPTRLEVDPAWSADGKVIACPVLIDGFFKILAVRVADQEAALISSKGWSVIRNLAWLPDSNSLIFIGTVKGNFHQLFQISYPGGEARQLTSDLYNYDDFSLSSDGRSLAAVKVEQTAHLWITPGNDVTRARQITSGFEKFDGIYSLDWISINKLLYTSSPSDDISSWTIEADGTEPKQLIRNGHYPTVSPDRQFIVYRNRIGSELALVRRDLSDGTEKVLTTGIIHYPTFSPDGKWLVFTKYNEGMALWKVPLEGGEPTRILLDNALCSAVSPNGKTIAFVLRRGGNSSRIALVSFDGGEIIKTFDAMPETNPLSNNRKLQWTPDGRSIYYVALNNGVSNIWRQPIDGSPPAQVTQFATGRIFNFAYSPDGNQLALSRGSLESDVVLIKSE